MSTMQIQKKKLLTFEELCPQWSKAVGQLYGGLPGDLSSAYRYCIVGEAWGFSQSYVVNCQECTNHAHQLISGHPHSSIVMDTDKDVFYWKDAQLDHNIADFMEHYNKVHNNV